MRVENVALIPNSFWLPGYILTKSTALRSTVWKPQFLLIQSQNIRYSHTKPLQFPSVLQWLCYLPIYLNFRSYLNLQPV
jgi:hypothetical protein